MKRLIIAALAVLLLALPVHAVQVTKTLIDGTVLDNNTAIATGTDYLGDADKVGFFVIYTETDTGAVIAASVRLQVSNDGTNWASALFYDFKGGTTPQSSETLTTATAYHFWFGEDVTVPYVQLIIDPAAEDASNTATVYGYSFKKQ